jgi:hypothetical protein
MKKDSENKKLRDKWLWPLVIEFLKGIAKGLGAWLVIQLLS